MGFSCYLSWSAAVSLKALFFLRNLKYLKQTNLPKQNKNNNKKKNNLTCMQSSRRARLVLVKMESTNSGKKMFSNMEKGSDSYKAALGARQTVQDWWKTVLRLGEIFVKVNGWKRSDSLSP